MTALGLHCVWAFSSCSEPGLLSNGDAEASACGGFSCCGAQALRRAGSSGCGAWAQGPCATWNPPIPGIEPVFPELAGGFYS